MKGSAGTKRPGACNLLSAMRGKMMWYLVHWTPLLDKVRWRDGISMTGPKWCTSTHGIVVSFRGKTLFAYCQCGCNRHGC